MSFHAASGYNTPFSKHAAKVMKKSQTNAKCFKILRFIHTFCVIYARLAIKSAKTHVKPRTFCTKTLSQPTFQSLSSNSLASPFASPSLSLACPCYLDALFLHYSHTIPMLPERLSSATLRLCYKGLS